MVMTEEKKIKELKPGDFPWMMYQFFRLGVAGVAVTLTDHFVGKGLASENRKKKEGDDE